MTLETVSAIAALAGRHAGSALPERLLIDTDTRSIEPGMTFLALRGQRFDGHAHVAEAFASGAAGCIVADLSSVPAGRPAIVVDDTLQAYLQLARLARTDVAGTVIGISGSTGKTTTKALLVQLLAAAGAGVIGTPENENNEIGVSKFLLGLDAGESRIAVIEMGARNPGDIDVLVAAARPAIAILTNIGEAHLEIMGSREALAHTKWGLFRTGAQAILNLADADSRERAATLTAPPRWFGSGDALPPAGQAALVIRDARTLDVYSEAGRRRIEIDVRLPGEHNRRNLAAALAGAVAAGIELERLLPHLAALALPSGRYETIALPDEKRLIFDAYNASLSGTLATLDAFAGEAAGRRIAVLGSMAELGPDAAQMHREAGAAAAAASEIVLAGGDFAAEIATGASDAGTSAACIVTFTRNADAVAWLQANTRPGDAILLKGSRKYKMEQIVAALTASGAA